MPVQFQNPFRPEAGYPPPHLAGREEAKKKFLKFLEQDVIMENMVLTGLRGTGKTVLLDTFKPLAIADGWKWCGTDLSESASISEDSMVKRLLADLSVVTSSITVGKEEFRRVGFVDNAESVELKLDYGTLLKAYEQAPGLVSDKLKSVLELAWVFLEESGARGLVFAYDEAQNFSDQALKEQFPLSVLLEAFQSLQKKGCRLLLVLSGLPTLFPELVKVRTYSERMFHVVVLGRLSGEASKDAVLKPIEDTDCPVQLTPESVKIIVELSGGYPYFIQFICREVYDAFIQGGHSVPTDGIIRKLGSDFFAARWARATDRQRELLTLIASFDNCDEEFTVRDIVSLSVREHLGVKPFSPGHLSRMLSTLMKAGLVYRNRWGNYALAIPLMGRFIRNETGMN